MVCQIRLFGDFCVVRDEQTFRHFPTQKAALLLAYLALTPQRTHYRESLAALLWPDATTASARHSLRQAVSSLRKLLGDGIFIAEGRERLRLAESVDVDVVRYEQLCQQGAFEEARTLKTGPLLEGFWEEWVLSERQRLEALLEPSQQMSAPSPKVVLPAPLTRFFGRDSEREILRQSLNDPTLRLLTLTGPGGVGKTRLSIEAARDTARFSFVLHVPLADLTDPRRVLELLMSTVAAARNAAARMGAPPLERLVELLGQEPTLLVLDNFEQLLETTSRQAIRSTLERCPALTILMTSRQALGLSGERELALRPLPTPEHPGTPERLLEFPSVQLFLDRAQAVRSDFALTDTNASALAALCSELEGIPLALELAARRVRALSPQQILTHLSDRFAFLQSRDVTIPERQRTLWNAIDGTVRLLDVPTRSVFLRLALFRGGWTLESAGVVGGSLEIHEKLLLTALIQSRELSTGVLRFTMLETLREYALAALTTEERVRTRQAHAAFFRDYALARQNELSSPRQAIVLAELDLELDNLRAARQTFAQNGESEGLLSLASSLALYFVRRGLFTEGREWLSEALEAETSLILPTAKVCDALGAICAAQADYADAEVFLSRGLTLRRALGDPAAVARSLVNLGTLGLDQGNLDDAYVRLSEAVPLVRETCPPLVIAITLGNLGIAALYRGDLELADACCEENLELRRQLGDTSGEGVALLNQGSVALRRGEGKRAETLYTQSLDLLVRCGDQPNLLSAADGLGQALVAQGRLDEAVRWFGAVAAKKRQVGTISKVFFAKEQAYYEEKARAILGSEHYELLAQEGERVGLTQLLGLLLPERSLLTIS